MRTTPYFLIIAAFSSALFYGIETVVAERLLQNVTNIDSSNSSSPTLEPSSSSQITGQPSQLTTTENPLRHPSSQPTSSPKKNPSPQPSKQPASRATRQPSRQPSFRRSQPSSSPTKQPTRQPSNQPTSSPNRKPSPQPSKQPVSRPTRQPSRQPSFRPSQPSSSPTKQPTRQPSNQPTSSPNRKPSPQPSKQPASRPTRQPSRQPSSQPSQPSSRPTARPSKQPFGRPSRQPSQQPKARPSSAPSSHPTSQPSYSPRPRAWFYDTFMDFRSNTYIVMYSITGFLFCVSMVVYFRSDLTKDRKTYWLNYISVFNFFLWSTFHLVMLCARLNFWLTHDNKYQPYKIDSNGGTVWIDPNKFFDAGKSTVKNHGCKHSFNHPKGYSPINYSPCRFLFFDISVFLMKEGEVKFSIGCGIIIYIIYQAFIVFLEYALLFGDAPNENADAANNGENAAAPVSAAAEAPPPPNANANMYALVAPGDGKGDGDDAIKLGSMQMVVADDEVGELLAADDEMPREPADAANNKVEGARAPNDGGGTGGILKYLNPCYLISLACKAIQEKGVEWVLKYIFTTLINCQQSLVLLPLTNMSTNDFCVEVFTPTNDENAVCLYKYAAYALPNGIIYALYGLIGAFLVVLLLRTMEAAASEENSWGMCIMFFVFLIGVGTAFCGFISVAFLVYYLFAGFFVGLWFQFGAYQWSLQTSRPELLSMALFIVADIMGAILNIGDN